MTEQLSFLTSFIPEKRHQIKNLLLLVETTGNTFLVAFIGKRYGFCVASTDELEKLVKVTLLIPENIMHHPMYKNLQYFIIFFKTT